MFWLLFFFFNDTATTEIYTLSLHDALPISVARLAETRFRWTAADPSLRWFTQNAAGLQVNVADISEEVAALALQGDRKSTRLNSSHANISYAVFCLKKKKLINHRSDCHPYN